MSFAEKRVRLFTAFNFFQIFFDVLEMIESRSAHEEKFRLFINIFWPPLPNTLTPLRTNAPSKDSLLF